MKCSNCHKEISDEFVFCPWCGVPMNGETAEYCEYEARRLRTIGKIRDALKMCEQALKLGDPDPYKFKSIGEMCYLLGEMGKAIESFNKSLELKPDFADTHYARGIAFYRAGFPREAIDDFQKTIKINSEFAMAYYWLGIAYFHTGKLIKAGAAFEMFLEKSPDSAIAHYHLGQVYLATGDPLRALEHLKILGQKNTENASIHYMLGKAYYRTYKIQDAIAAFRKAVELNPEDEQARNFLERLLSPLEP